MAFVNQIVFTVLLLAVTSHANMSLKCTTKNSCEKKPSCQCYCSEVGHFRAKNASDKPVFVDRDPRKKYCFCKKWDLLKYPGPVKRD